ncbi:MAG TPA: lipoprotein [Micropepsaceae bacterium]|nr:lipoprotein [Micropepsaceae bacterium]
MSLRLAPIALLALAMAGCGVKSDLDRPMGAIVQPARQVLESPRKDPSKPPTPLGEPGGTTPPYTTGP